MLLRLLPYHLRLALRSLRRDPGLSAAIMLVMAVVGGLFCVCMMHFLRTHGPSPPASPDLHQVEVLRTWGSGQEALDGTSAETSAIAMRMRISYPSYRTLAGSGIPTRETATFRARLLVQSAQLPDTKAAAIAPLVDPGPGTYRSRPRNARFVNADFFSLFAVPLRHGAAWSRDEEARGEPVVVLSKALNDELFGGANSVGGTVLVNGRPHRVAGVCAHHQPFVPEWDRALTGDSQDSLYVPFPEHERLAARPEMPIFRAPTGPGYGDLLASGDVLFLSYWLELPTAAQREGYARYLAGSLGARGVSYVLRDLAGVRRDLPQPHGAITFFLFVTSLIMVAGGLIMARLLLAKGLARRDELGIFRALGAPRASLFSRQLLEALLLSGAAGVASLAVSWPASAFYNRAVADTDIPLALSGAAFGVTFAVTVAVGILFAIFPAWRAANRGPKIAGAAGRGTR